MARMRIPTLMALCLVAALARCGGEVLGPGGSRPGEGGAGGNGNTPGDTRPSPTDPLPGSPEDEGDDDLGSTCEADTCSGKGRCNVTNGRARCTCDLGFVGAACNAQGADFWSKSRVAVNLADPEIYKEHDDLFFLTGTRSGRSLDILETTDLVEFKNKVTYVPQDADPTHDYCDVWAPDLAKVVGEYKLHFSARRLPRGSNCAANPGVQVATFVATAKTLDLAFGAPVPLDFGGVGRPRTVISPACPADGCEQAIRIDSAVYQDGKGAPWFLYVYFNRGNNISMFRTDAATRLIHNAGPVFFNEAASADEQGINEGPDVFERNGKYYLYFSHANFDQHYAMSYVMADSVDDLTRRRVTRRNSWAMAQGGQLVETHGHNVVTSRRGEYFNFLHQGKFEAGRFQGRDTHRQRIGFRADGSMETFNRVNLRWSSPGAGYQYSLDVVGRDGTVIGPCQSAGILGGRSSTVYDGICPDAGGRVLHKGDVKTFRLYYSNDGTWGRFVEAAYDGHSDDVFLALPGGTVSALNIQWNEMQTYAAYSLDLQRKNGTWVGPCSGPAAIGKRLSFDHTGQCQTARDVIPVNDIAKVRVCSATNDEWNKARCGEVAYDGSTATVFVRIP